MFTGIVQSIGQVRAVEAFGGEARDRRITIACPDIPPGRRTLGDSVSVSGVCLSVAAERDDGFECDVSVETLTLTTIGRLGAGSEVNLEAALTLESGLGGHLVSGHVDGLGRLESREDEVRSTRMRFSFPPALAAFIAAKGSLCVDGVSLTVNDVEGREFGVNIIPHTAAVTTLGAARPGSRFNLEVDLIARYVERLLDGDRTA